MIVDKAGYRLNVGIVIANKERRVFWGRRLGQLAWQFPQGGVATGESATDAMYRELTEEVGLSRKDVTLIASTKHWLKYRLPKQYLRRGNQPVVVGQKQKWFLLRLDCPDQKIRLDASDTPEFDSWRWVQMDESVEGVIYFKQRVYRQAIDELANHMHKLESQGISQPPHRRGSGDGRRGKSG